MKNIIYILLVLLTLISFNSCEQEQTNIIDNQEEPLIITYSISSITTIDCNDGKIDVTVSGGVAPYSFLWSTGSVSEDLDSISIGEYKVEVTDAKRLITEETIYVNEDYLLFKPLVIGYEISLISSIRDKDGRIKVNAQGGETPYSYFWSTGDLDNEIENITLGEYEVTVTDMQGQEVSQTFTINEDYIIYKVPEDDQDGWEVSHINDNVNNKEYLIEALKELHISNSELHSILISLDNKLILEEYFPGYDSQGNFHHFNRFMPHEVQSASKSYRSTLIGIAILNGFIENEQVPIIDLLPEYLDLINNGKEDIFLEHILSMSSGLEWNEWYGTPNSLYEMYELPYSQWFSYVLSKPIESTPGTQWEYHSGASMMLNEIVTNAIDTDIYSFVEEYFNEKIESSNTQGFGNPIGASSVPRDMLKLGQVYLNDGKWKDNQIISKEWINKSFERKFYVSETDTYYGYQWWSRDLITNHGTYVCNYAWGNGGQYIMVIKELDLVAVFTGEAFNTFAPKPFEIMERFIIPALE